ncbi:MAG: hypothetical protein JOZ08_08620 [Verrucomicrobia bacterium]|nr:hypothetical protein [Verrucomicrobiota bacterium]MBV8279706.1 hypothetical protein [Verrucomicrobiota bacterium]
MKNRVLPGLAALLFLSGYSLSSLRATDLTDPSEIIRRNAAQNQVQQGQNVEVDGMIESVKPGETGWFSLILELDNGNQITVIVYPKTKFYQNYKAMDTAAAYKLLAHGQKIRMLHNTYMDTYVKHTMISDLMFVDK